MKMLFFCVVFHMFGLGYSLWIPEGNVIAEARLHLHLPLKHTDPLCTFRLVASPMSLIILPKKSLMFVNMTEDTSFPHGDQRSSPLLKQARKRFLVVLLLLMAGLSPNPGPIGTIATPLDFSNRTGLGIVHLNACSLLPKMDRIKIWASTTKTDILVISETWLKKSISNRDIALEGYNLF